MAKFIGQNDARKLSEGWGLGDSLEPSASRSMHGRVLAHRRSNGRSPLQPCDANEGDFQAAISCGDSACKPTACDTYKRLFISSKRMGTENGVLGN